MLQTIIDWILANKIAVLTALLLLISEVQALVPSWKSSGIVDFIIKALKGLGAQSPTP